MKAKIVETEAYYDEKDPASRACQNGDLRETMLMEAGTILVYGVHNSWLINFVTGKKGEAAAKPKTEATEESKEAATKNESAEK